jgi:two-component system chemotaxis response regulator CheY
MSNRSALVTELRPGRRTLLTELVQDAGFLLVVEASSHQHAYECVERVDFDMLFVEVEHARDPRFTLIHRVRHDRNRNYRAPIIVVSADTHRGVIQRARDSGAHGFLARPFSRASVQLQVTRGLVDRRGFIESPKFIGPDRRRWSDPTFRGADRRLHENVALI